MKWNKFRLKTTTEAEDIVSSMLADLGIEGVEIEDKIPLTESDKEQMFVDILPEIEPDDGVAYLSFYLEEEADTEAVLAMRIKWSSILLRVRHLEQECMRQPSFVSGRSEST